MHECRSGSPAREWTFSGELAAKFASEQAGGPTTHTHTELVGLRVVRDLVGQNYTDEGIYLWFGLKFDEDLLGLLGRSPASGR